MTKLHQFLEREGISSSVFARQLGVHPSVVSRWRRGETRPSPPRLLRIAKETRGAVPVEAWFDSGEVA